MSTKKVSAIAAINSKIKNENSATSKARSSQPVISPAARRQYESNLLNAFQAMKEGMSVHRASRQYGVPESTLRVWTKRKVSADHGRPLRSSKHTASPLARPKHETTLKNAVQATNKHEGTSLVDAVQATTKRKSSNKASKQDGVPESTRRDKARGNNAINHRNSQQSSKPTTSPTAKHKFMKYDEVSLVKALKASINGMSVYKASRLYGVPKSTLFYRNRRIVSTQRSGHIASGSARLQYDETRLVNAYQATKRGLSIYKASKLYGVPKSTLRYRTIRKEKRPYNEVNVVNAVKAIQEGMSAYKAGKQFGVPPSTLRDKSRGIVKIDSTKHRQSSNPTPLKMSQCLLYNKTNLIQASETAKGGMSVRKAARQHGVPESTLRDLIKRNVVIEDARTGQRNIFTSDQEQKMVDHIKHMANIGYKNSKSDIKYFAADYANAFGQNLPANKPLCDSWYSGFIKRWPDLQSVLKHKKESKARCASQDASKNYFKELANILTTNNLLESPESIYNIDGYLLSKEHTPPQSVSNVTTKPKAIKTQPVTIIGGGSASGYYIPPYFVFSCRWKPLYVEGSPPGTAGAMKGWSNSDVLKNYLEMHFAKYAFLSDSRRKGYKTLVLYDGNKYHLSLFMADWAKKNHVILFVLPPGGSHVTEPHDAGLLRPFQFMYSSECQLYRSKNPGIRITKYNFAKLAAKSYLMAMSPTILKAVFCNAGIYPFPNSISANSQVTPTAGVISFLSDDQDKQNNAMQQSPTADIKPILNETVARPATNIATQEPAFLIKKEKFTTFSDAGPTYKESCHGIPMEDGSDDCGGIETKFTNTTNTSPLPDPSVCASVSASRSISSDCRPSVKEEKVNCFVFSTSHQALQQSPTADIKPILTETVARPVTNIATPEPAFLIKKERFTTF